MAVIKYRGRVLKKIYEGQKITLHTQGRELEGDIEIEGFNGEEAPNFTTEVVTATPTKTTQTITPSTADFISKAVVKPIPEEYVVPQGSVTLTTNGDHDVSGKKTATVNVRSGVIEGSITPSNSINPKVNWLRKQGSYVIGEYRGSELLGNNFPKGPDVRYMLGGAQYYFTTSKIGTIPESMRPSELVVLYGVAKYTAASTKQRLERVFITTDGQVLIEDPSLTLSGICISIGYEVKTAEESITPSVSGNLDENWLRKQWNYVIGVFCDHRGMERPSGPSIVYEDEGETYQTPTLKLGTVPENMRPRQQVVLYAHGMLYDGPAEDANTRVTVIITPYGDVLQAGVHRLSSISFSIGYEAAPSEE